MSGRCSPRKRTGLPPLRPLADLAEAQRGRLIRSIRRWERDEYGPGQCRTLGSIEARLRVYDEGIVCLLDGSRLLGYVEVLPLSPSHYALLRDGRVVEERIPSRWFGGRRSPARNACWYVGSMIVARRLRTARPDLAHRIAAALRAATWAAIGAHGRFPVRVLGISATDAGRAVFLRTGFVPVACPADAVDPRPRFEQVFRTHAQLLGRT
jgi:hypothetical protein